MLSLNVSLGARSYPIYIGPALLDTQLSAFVERQVVVVTNEVVAPLYLARMVRPLKEAGIRVSEIILPDGESHKNWESLNHIYDRLLAER
ncbi:MAG: 3-dehydroquinate synthase, partial [Rhodocyclaceae bacterium]|nr:3-dehydroquinate synthase [Rhodocyclaceae bacterium]